MKQLISLQDDPVHGEASNVHRWMVSYADFITLLFVLFLVLYAKLPKPNETPAPAVQALHAPLIANIRPRRAPAQAATATPAPSPEPVEEKQRVLSQELARSLGELLAPGDITLVTRPDGVLLEIKDTALFASGTAQPAAQAAGVLAKIAAVLEKSGNSVVVEGHTDSVPIQTAQYPSNWELSSARAASVVRALQEHGIRSTRLTASGLADTKPKSTNETAQGRRENRRVSLLILNDAGAGDSAALVAI